MIKISSGQSEKTSKCASVTGDSGGVLQNMHWNLERTPILKCDFNNISIQCLMDFFGLACSMFYKIVFLRTHPHCFFILQNAEMQTNKRNLWYTELIRKYFVSSVKVITINSAFVKQFCCKDLSFQRISWWSCGSSFKQPIHKARLVLISSTESPSITWNSFKQPIFAQIFV